VNSMQRHLDIQFRLLREEMMYDLIPNIFLLHIDFFCLFMEVLPSDNPLER
jgi:hypothetical protein